MSKFARVIGGLVLETVELPGEITPDEAFHADIAANFLACGESVSCGWIYVDGEFSESETTISALDMAKAARIAILTADCAAAIVGGYVSPALGAEHRYPSGVTDQINMMGSVTASLLPDIAPDWSTPFWCADEAGEWAFRMHSADQIQHVGRDGKQHIVDCQSTLTTLTAEVEAAETAETVAAIVWPNS